MRTEWISVTEDRARRHSLYGIGGWLLFFLLTVFFQFLWCIGQLKRLSIELGAPMVDAITFAGGSGFLLRDQLVVSALSLLILTSLASLRWRSFRSVSIAVLVAQWPMVALLAQLWPTPPTPGSLLPSFALACLLCALWLPYLQLSRRVRVTFESQVASSDTSIPQDKIPSVSATPNTIGWGQFVGHVTVILGVIAISVIYLRIGHEVRLLEEAPEVQVQRHTELVPQIAPMPILEAQPLAADDTNVLSAQAGPEYPPLRPAEIYSSFRSGVDPLRYFAVDDTIELDKMTLTASQKEQIDALVTAATADGEFSYVAARGIDISGDQSLELLMTKNSGGTSNVQDADVYQIRAEEPTVRPMFQFPSGYGHVSFLRFDGRPGLHVASTLQGFRYQFGPGVDAVYSTSVAKVDGLGLIPAPEIMSNPIIVYCAGRVARVAALDSAQCLSAWDSNQAKLISKFEQARKSRTRGSGNSKNWDNLMVAATHIIEPLVNSGHHEQADAYLQEIWPSDDPASLREFRDRYWGAIDKKILVGDESK